MTEALRGFASANERSARTKMNPEGAPFGCVLGDLALVLNELEEQPQAELGFIGRLGENFLFEDAKGHEDALIEQLVSDHAGFAGHQVFLADYGRKNGVAQWVPALRPPVRSC